MNSDRCTDSRRIEFFFFRISRIDKVHVMLVFELFACITEFSWEKIFSTKFSLNLPLAECTEYLVLFECDSIIIMANRIYLHFYWY